MPRTHEAWYKISAEFDDNWNFPKCIGAIDGKHIIVQGPIHNGSEYYNYKGSESSVLLGIVDANYSFIYVDVASAVRAVFHTEVYGKIAIFLDH